jgi:acid phosphatase (class A)
VKIILVVNYFLRLFLIVPFVDVKYVSSLIFTTMSNKKNRLKNQFSGFLILFTLISGFTASSQWIHPLEPISQHYKTLASLNAEPNTSRKNLDSILFPWKEYSKSALGNSIWRTYYLSAVDEEKLPSYISCPANSSDQTKGDLEYLLKLQNTRTKADTTKAQFIAQIGSWPNIINPTDPDFAENRTQLFYIASTVGDWFNSDNFPATTQLLLNCIQDIRVTEFRLKRHFKRPRPYHLEPMLNPITRINSPSFASGHTLWAFTEAFLFAELIPEKRNSFILKAEEVRWSREILGLHYPSDNEASRIIAWHLVCDWFKNSKFVSDFEKAKIEWKLKSELYKKSN